VEVCFANQGTNLFHNRQPAISKPSRALFPFCFTFSTHNNSISTPGFAPKFVAQLLAGDKCALVLTTNYDTFGIHFLLRILFLKQFCSKCVTLNHSDGNGCQ
jgi:hypothetical protein